VTCEVLAAGLLGCDAVSLLGEQFRRFDRTALSGHEDGGNTIFRTVGTTRPAQRHGVILHTTAIFTISFCRLARSLFLPTTLSGLQKTHYQLKNTIYSMFLWQVHTCSNVQPNYNKTATGALRDAVPNSVKAFFTFEMACGFAVRACLDLPAHETCGLPSHDFHEVRKRTATLRYTVCQPHRTTRIEIHLCL